MLFSIGFYYFFNQSIKSSVKSNLYQKALFIKSKIELNNDLNTFKFNHYANLDIAILKNNHIFIKTPNFKINNLTKYLNKYIYFTTINQKEYLSAILVLKFQKPFNGAIVLLQSDIDDKVENLINTMLILNPILLLFLIIFANKLIDKILIPIKEITKTTQKITINNLSNIIEAPKNNDELKLLVDSFNSMILRLKDGFEQIDRFNSDISHELKTPITIIKGEANFALKKQRSVQEYKKGFQVIINQANEMNEMIDNLLLLLQYTKDNIKDSFSYISVDELLISVLDKYNISINNKNIKIHLEKFEMIQYCGNLQLLSIIFSNIIDNAIKYTPNNKNIYISLFKKLNHIYFIVKDEGIGIPNDKLNLITNRFYRVDESRNKNIKGFGLGLSIVKNGIDLHNGILNIYSKESKGTMVEVIL